MVFIGEEDTRWETIGSNNESAEEESTESKSDWISTIMGVVKKMDPNQMQNHINNLSQALGAVQSVLSQFQGNNPAGGPAKPQEGPRHPFLFRKTNRKGINLCVEMCLNILKVKRI